MQSILFITTSSLATNPRLVKEFEYLKKGYHCTVICFEHEDWCKAMSKHIMARNESVHFVVINRKKELFSTLFAKALHLKAKLLNQLVSKSIWINAFASNDKTPQLLIKGLGLGNRKFSKVIAHNLGAFFPAMIIANQKNCQLQLDIEDYHPGEEFYFNKKHEGQNRLLIIQKAITRANAITYASKGIQLACENKFKFNNKTKRETIINAFDQDDFMKPIEKADNTIKCVWFSQNISAHRGLDQVFEAATKHSNIQFHLVGKANELFIKAMLPAKNVIIHAPMAQAQLHQFLNTMDIGLALEKKDIDGNRDICLTNKFLAYAQAGLYILATDTFGQRDFLECLDYKAGQILQNTLSETLNDFDLILINNTHKLKRWEKAKNFSWSAESEKLNRLMT